MKSFFIKSLRFLAWSLLCSAIILLSGGLFLPRVVFAAEPGITYVDVNDLFISHKSAGASSPWSKALGFPTDADALRYLMGCQGWAGDPIDVVEMIGRDGKPRLVSYNNTRPTVWYQLGTKEKIPVRIFQPTDLMTFLTEQDLAFWATEAQRLNKKHGYRLNPNPRTWGEIMEVRLARQGAAWFKKYPVGAPVNTLKLAGAPLTPEQIQSCADCKSLKVPPMDWRKLEEAEARRLEANQFFDDILRGQANEITRIYREIAILQDQLSNTVRAGDEAAAAALRGRIRSSQTAVAGLEETLAREIARSVNEDAHWPMSYDEIKKDFPEVYDKLKKGPKAIDLPEECAPKPPPKPPPKPCPPGTTFQGYHTIPENIDDIIKLYRGMSYDDVLADIDHFLKTGRPDVAGRIAQAMQQSIDDELAAARPSGNPATNPNWDVQLERYGAKVDELRPASDELGKLRGKIKAAKPPACPTEAELAARAGKLFDKRAAGTLRNTLQKLKPTEIKEGVQKVKDFFTGKGTSWKSIRAQLLSKFNIVVTVIFSGVEVFIRIEEIDELLMMVENYNEHLDRSIRNIQQAKAELKRSKMDPRCTVKDPKDPKNLNAQRDAIIAEIYHALILAQSLDATNARLIALHDDAWLGKDWFSRLRGWRSGFGSKTNYTEAVVDLYPELEGGTCAEDEECAPLSLIPICRRDGGGGGGGGGAGGGGGSGWDISGADVCNFPIVTYADWGETRYEPKGSRSGFVGQCIGAVQCCAMADCAPGPYANVWGLRLRSGRVVRIWGCQGLPRELSEGECRQPDFTSLEMNALCNESEQEWSPELRARVAALEQAANIALTGSSSGDAGPAIARGGDTRSGKPLDFQFGTFSVTNFAARLAVAGLLAER